MKVIEVFSEVRTPCPPVGTVGEWYDTDGKYCCVRFLLPMEDTEGATWLSHGQGDDYMRLKFLPDEIELC